MPESRHSVAARRLTVYQVAVCLIWSLLTVSQGSPTSGDSPVITQFPGTPRTSGVGSETVDSPFDDLAKLLGIHRVPLHLRSGGRRPTTPEYFEHLFKSTSDVEGIARRPAPYHADTISGYMDRAPGNQRFYFYNITAAERSSARFLNAEFHLFRVNSRLPRRSKRSTGRRFLLLKIYTVLNPRRRHTPYGNRLIDMKRIISSQRGWVVFNISEAVNTWIANNGSNNYGVLITAQNSDGSLASMREIKFAQRGHHHDRLQPIIAVYTQNNNHSTDQAGEKESAMTRAFDEQDPNRYTNMYHGLYYLPPSSDYPSIPSDPSSSQRNSQRTRRSVEASDSGGQSNDGNQWTNDSPSNGVSSNRNRGNSRRGGRRRGGSSANGNGRRGGGLVNMIVPYCSRHTMLVDFSKMGWDQWIISPSRFNARVCSGPCPFPLGQAYHPTNHAVVQSIWHHLRPGNTLVKQPCCVPHSLNALNMLYYDEELKVVLKSYDNMVVTSCGCK